MEKVIEKQITSALIFRAVRAALGHDQNQYWIVLVFALQAGALSLGIPIAVQSFVNSVSFIGTLQPVLILSMVLLGVLSMTVILQLLQTTTVEKLERRFFGFQFSQFMQSLPLITGSTGQPRSHLGMQFWELVSATKNMKTIFIESLALLLQMLTGFVLISFYHPWFLAFGIALSLSLFILIRTTRVRSIQTRYELSDWLYELANLSQDVARSQRLFLSTSSRAYLRTQVDHSIQTYLNRRKNYFSIVIRQTIGLMAFYALGSGLLFALGGVLVLREQLSLGQLVAAEIVISALLYNIWKFGSKIESIDSFFVSLLKIDKLLSSKQEAFNQDTVMPDQEPSSVNYRFRNAVHRSITLLQDPFQLSISAFSKLLIHGGAGSGKSAMSKVLSGETPLEKGTLEFCGQDIRELPLQDLTQRVIRVRREEILHASIADNLRCLNPNVSTIEMRRVLEQIGLLDRCSNLPRGLDTLIYPTEMILDRQERILLIVARVILAKPQVAIFDEILDTLAPNRLHTVLDYLLSDDFRSIVVITSQHELKHEGFSDRLHIKARVNS